MGASCPCDGPMRTDNGDGDFVYLATTDFTGDPMPLCRLTYRKNAEYWGFAIYLASSDTYENSILPNGQPTATPEQALDCACGL